MKTFSKIFILFLCLIFSSELKSQSYLGVKGGVNIPTVNFSDFTNVPITTNFRSRYFVAPIYGISYRYMQNDKIGIQIDLNYSTKGWGQNTRDYSNYFVTTIDYLELPFYLHWQLLGGEKFKFFIDAGIYVAWALKASQLVANEADLNQNQILYQVDKDNRGDFGIYAGAGFSYAFSNFTLQLDGSFKSGFANILPANHFIRKNPVISTNQVPAVQLSILVPFLK